MSALTWLLIVISQIALVLGQLLLKRGMERQERSQTQWKRSFAGGILAMTVWFLLWLGLMNSLDLSKLMPLEGISPLLIVLSSVWLFGEKVSFRAWLGIACTCLGVILVSQS